MDVPEFVRNARDAMTARRVFSEPYVQAGVTVIAAARIWGGGGEGSAGAVSGEHGGGGGYGLHLTPAGAYVIRDGVVNWVPAIDMNRVILGGQIVAIALFLTLRSLAPILLRERKRSTKPGRRRRGGPLWRA